MFVVMAKKNALLSHTLIKKVYKKRRCLLVLLFFIEQDMFGYLLKIFSKLVPCSLFAEVSVSHQLSKKDITRGVPKKGQRQNILTMSLNYKE